MSLTPEILSLEATVKLLETIVNTPVNTSVYYPELTSSIDAIQHVIKCLKNKNEKIKTKS